MDWYIVNCHKQREKVNVQNISSSFHLSLAWHHAWMPSVVNAEKHIMLNEHQFKHDSRVYHITCQPLPCYIFLAAPHIFP